MTPDPLAKADYWEVMSETGDAWVQAGAEWLLKNRYRQQGFPSPADWLQAATNCQSAHYRALDREVAKDDPVGHVEAHRLIEELKAKLKGKWYLGMGTRTELKAQYLFSEILHQVQGVNDKFAVKDPCAVKALAAIGGIEVMKVLGPNEVLEARNCFVDAYIECAGGVE